MPAPQSDSKPLTVVRLLAESLRPFWILLGLGILAGCIDLVAQISIPWILRYLIDDVLAVRNPEGLGLGIALLLATALATTIARTMGRYVYGKLSAVIAIDLRDRLAAQLRRLSLREVYRHRSGETMSLFTTDVPVVAAFYEVVLGQAIVNVIRFAVTLGVLVYLFRGMALIVLLLLPIYSLLPLLFSQRLRKANEELQQCKAELSGDLQDSIAATREIKAMDRARWDTRRLHHTFERLLGPHLQLAIYEALSSSTFLLFWVSAAVIYWIGGQLVFSGDMTVGELLAAISYFTYLDVPVAALIGTNAKWQKIKASTQRVTDFLVIPQEPKDPPGARPLEHCRGEIRFEDVDFAYDEGTEVLRRISLHVNAGERVALVGASGSGKTSLISLLLRLHSPSGGRISLDGVDLREVTSSSLRSACGVAFQDSYLFPGTVEDNIRFGDSEASFDAVENASRIACAHDFVSALDEGYQTRVGERGATLSAGQKQRIALARAILRDPAVLILDEATSALDSATEQKVLAALDRELRGKTVLFIAHRLSTVLAADRLLLLHEGTIRAEGTHSELMESSALYRDLYGAQKAL